MIVTLNVVFKLMKFREADKPEKLHAETELDAAFEAFRTLAEDMAGGREDLLGE